MAISAAGRVEDGPHRPHLMREAISGHISGGESGGRLHGHYRYGARHMSAAIDDQRCVQFRARALRHRADQASRVSHRRHQTGHQPRRRTTGLRRTRWHSVALRGTLRHSEALRGTQRHSVGLGGTRWHSSDANQRPGQRQSTPKTAPVHAQDSANQRPGQRPPTPTWPAEKCNVRQKPSMSSDSESILGRCSPSFVRPVRR